MMKHNFPISFGVLKCPYWHVLPLFVSFVCVKHFMCMQFYVLRTCDLGSCVLCICHFYISKRKINNLDFFETAFLYVWLSDFTWKYFSFLRFELLFIFQFSKKLTFGQHYMDCTCSACTEGVVKGLVALWWN